MPTKDELEQQLDEANARIAELEEAAAAGSPVTEAPARPSRPVDDNGKPILSAGEADDLANHGVTVSPFNGETLDAITEGVEPSNPTARRRAELEHKRRPAVVDVAGDAPAAD
jgi:hypothetical protein